MANHEYIIDSDEWREYQELRRRETQRRRNPRRRVDIPALLVLLLFVAACVYVLYSRYFGAPPVISIAPQRTSVAQPSHPSPELLTALAIRAAQPPDTNNPAVSAPDDYQEHSKPSTRSAPPVAEPTAAPVVQFVPDVQPTNAPVSADDGSRVAPAPPPAVLIESALSEPAQTEHTKQNIRKAPGAK